MQKTKNKKSSKLKIIIPFLLVIYFFIPAVSLAQEVPTFKPQVTIDDKIKAGGKGIEIGEVTGAGKNKEITMTLLPEYIRAYYNYGIGAVGILATVILMYGGILWIVAAGNAERIGEAKAWVGAALSGLVLALSSYTILYVVNPQLVGIGAKPITISIVELTEEGNEISENYKDFKCFYQSFGKDKSEVERQLTSVNFLGRDYRVHEKMAPSLIQASKEILSSGINYQSTAGIGYNWRKNVNNPTIQSLHSWGVAVDINPSKNPNSRKASKSDTCKTDIPEELISIMKITVLPGVETSAPCAMLCISSGLADLLLANHRGIGNNI